jgi:hypothetical protein
MRTNKAYRGVTTSLQTTLSKIKKWVLPGKGKSRILAIIGGKADRDAKIIYKKYGVRVSQHLTLMITSEGFVDVHLTEEGKKKKYTPLFKGYIDLPYLKERAQALYQKSLKPIEVNNSRFSSFYVLIPKSAEAYMEFYLRSYVRGHRIVLPATKREEREIEDYLEEYFDIFSFSEVTTYRIQLGLCVNEKGDMGILIGDKRNYYFFSITDAMNIFLNSIKSASNHN